MFNIRELNYNYLNQADKHVSTPATELVSDLIFKYEEKVSKARLISDDLNNKKIVEKAKYFLNYYQKM